MSSISGFSPRSRSLLLLAAAALLPPVAAQGQQPSDTMFVRAHRLVSQGQGVVGRAMIDSLLTATAPGSPAYAEGLFWRASTAVKAEDAERDYLRIVIEYPLSGRAEDALIRLAELEMMRGDRVRAQRHLQRLIVEHPNGASRARASYWLARVFFDGNDLPRACNELNVARARASSSDVELRNQVEYQAQRCVGVAVVAPSPQAPASSGAPAGAVAVASPSPAATVVKPPVATSAPPSAPVTSPSVPPTVPASTVPATQGPTVPATPAGSGATVPRTSAPAPAVTVPGPASSPPASSTPPRPAPAPTAPATPATTSRSTPGFSVQVAAFPTQAAANTFRESLAARGYDVRVWGTEAPFRVRVGRFATRAEAGALAQELRGKMIAKDAYVVEAEVR
jgi:cell division protein FtsN